jgi:TolB-like protein/tetratricopeptide (TPR) repeat protein
MSDPGNRLFAFLAELKRRHVARVAIVYAVIGFGVLQVANNFFPALHLPAWTVTLVAVLIVLGFPIALVLAWAFQVTPDGVKREEPRTVSSSEPGVVQRRDAGRSFGYLGVGILVGLVVVGLSFQAIGRDAGEAGSAADSTATATAPEAAVRSIAVLPFANLSTDPENEAFSDGLTEELLNALAQVEGLRVPARTSSFAFKNVNHDIREIGQKLDVEMVLEGSVRKAAGKLRVTVQLISVADGAHLWSQNYDRELADVFAIQEEIAEAIVGQILPRFAGTSGGTDLVRPTTDDVDAYQSYLQGRHQFWQQGGEPGLRRAAAFFEVAIEQDPDYAIAYASLADAFMLLGGSGFAPPGDVFPASKAAALRALELDSLLAEGYVALASINWLYDWDWAAAARNYRLSFSVNPLLHTRCICYAWYLAVTGSLDAAVLEAERARSMDPLARLPRIIASWMYYLSGRHADAQAQLAELFEMSPGDASGRRITAWIAWDQGNRDAAITELEKLRAVDDERGGFAERGSPVIVADLATMYARAGRQPDATQLLEKLKARAGRQYIPPEYIAAIHGALGQHDEALRWLEDAFTNRSNLAQFNALPLSEPLRGHAGYQQLLSRVGLPSRPS